MWFTGRVSGAATVLVLEPSQVTGLPEEAGAFDTGVRAGVVAVPPEDPAPEEPAEAEEFVAADGSVAVEGAAGAGVEEAVAEGLVPVARPSSVVPVPSLHAVSESAARTVVAAATRRVREGVDMVLCPFGVRVAVVIG
jgi:hypothetical protein